MPVFRMEILGACFITQLLGGATEASGVVHVDLQCAVDRIPLSCIQFKSLLMAWSREPNMLM